MRAIEDLLEALCGTTASQSLATVSRSLAILLNYRHRDASHDDFLSQAAAETAVLHDALKLAQRVSEFAAERRADIKKINKTLV